MGVGQKTSVVILGPEAPDKWVGDNGRVDVSKDGVARYIGAVSRGDQGKSAHLPEELGLG